MEVIKGSEEKQEISSLFSLCCGWSLVRWRRCDFFRRRCTSMVFVFLNNLQYEIGHWALASGQMVNASKRVAQTELSSIVRPSDGGDEGCVEKYERVQVHRVGGKNGHKESGEC